MSKKQEEIETLLTDSKTQKAIRAVAALWWKRNQDCEHEEIVAVVTLGFIMAAHRYDPARGILFHSYAWKSGYDQARRFIHNHVHRGMLHERRTMERGLIPYEIDDYRMVGKDLAEETINTQRFWGEIKLVLSPHLYRVLVEYYREGRTGADIAQEMGVSKQDVYQLITKAIKKLRKSSLADLDRSHNFLTLLE